MSSATRYRVDANVLIALIDPAHVRHDDAHHWFAGKGKRAWATCPITENDALRIVGNSRYPLSPGNPAAVAKILIVLRNLGSHEFWSNDISLLDRDAVEATRLLNSAQVTDSYLLALAKAAGLRHLTANLLRMPLLAAHRLCATYARRGRK